MRPKTQLTHVQYYQFRRWIEQLGKDEVAKVTTAQLAALAAEKLSFAVSEAAISGCLKELGWNKAATRAENPSASQVERRFAQLEERVAKLEERAAVLEQRLC